MDLDLLSERQLERLYAGLVRLASMDETVLAALVEPTREELERKARGDCGGVRQVEPLVGEASLARELLELC